MNTELFIAVLAGLGGMFGWGLADFFAKKTIDAIGDITSLVWAHVCGTIILAILALYELAHGVTPITNITGNAWLGLIFFGVLQAIVYLLVYRGFGKGQVSLLNPVFASFSGIVALLSVAFFGEILTGNLLISLVIVFAGIMMLNLDPAALKERRIALVSIPGFKEVGLATLFAAGWTILWKQFVTGQDWLWFALYMYVFMTVAMLLYAWVRRISLRISLSSVWIYLFLIGLFETGAYIAISYGYSRTPLTSVVALLSGAFSLPTIVLARIFLKERVTRFQTIGSLIIVLGIVLVSLL